MQGRGTHGYQRFPRNSLSARGPYHIRPSRHRGPDCRQRPHSHRRMRNNHTINTATSTIPPTTAANP